MKTVSRRNRLIIICMLPNRPRSNLFPRRVEENLRALCQHRTAATARNGRRGQSLTSFMGTRPSQCSTNLQVDAAFIGSTTTSAKQRGRWRAKHVTERAWNGSVRNSSGERKSFHRMVFEERGEKSFIGRQHEEMDKLFAWKDCK